MPVHLTTDRGADLIQRHRQNEQREHIQMIEQSLDGLAPGDSLSRKVQMPVDGGDTAIYRLQPKQRPLAFRREQTAEARSASAESPTEWRPGAP